MGYVALILTMALFLSSCQVTVEVGGRPMPPPQTLAATMPTNPWTMGMYYQRPPRDISWWDWNDGDSPLRRARRNNRDTDTNSGG